MSLIYSIKNFILLYDYVKKVLLDLFAFIKYRNEQWHPFVFELTNSKSSHLFKVGRKIK